MLQILWFLSCSRSPHNDNNQVYGFLEFHLDAWKDKQEGVM